MIILKKRAQNRGFTGPTKWLFAAWYDLLNTGVEPRIRRYREATAGRATGDVLEIGGGTGANLQFFPSDANLTILEPNPHMASRLGRRAEKLRRKVNIVSGIGENLPFKNASFHSVVTTLILCMVHDLDAVVREAKRVLKPGGAFYFYEHVVSPRPRGRWWQNKLNPTWKCLTTGCNLNRDITGAIYSAGFSHIEIETFDLSVGLPVTIPNIVGMAKA